MFVQSEVYAKPGELLQGALPGNKPFLLSNRSSRIFKNTIKVSIANLSDKQKLNSKSQKAVEVYWSSVSEKQKLIDISKLYVKSGGNIPVGKGLSSSSADVLGILHALNLFYKTQYPVEKLYELAAIVEPTDPCLHTGNLLFDQHNGEIIQPLSALPYQFIYFDSDMNTLVDTITFSQKTNYTESHQQEYKNLCKTIIEACVNQDYASFYYCLNKSAEISHSFLPKKNFHVLQDFAFANQVGLFVAHSGTYMGLVVAPPSLNRIKLKATELIKKNWNTSIYTE